MSDRPMWTVLAVILVMGLAACQESDSFPPEDQFPLASGQNVDPAGLERARAQLAANRQTRCLLVERNGVVVMEEYFNGATASEFHDVRSVTKTVTSILIGSQSTPD
jgi:CubicO group peptidase (beta-lactamase class C family)